MAANDKKDFYGALGVKKSQSAEEIRKAFRKLGVVLIFLMLQPLAFSQDSNVRGTVWDATGKPLPEVSVYSWQHFQVRSLKQNTKTDSQGHFELKSVGRVIFFKSQKYEALTYVRPPNQPVVDIILREQTEDLTPKTCPEREKTGERYGLISMFLVPRGTNVKHYSGDDSFVEKISLPGSTTAEHLYLESGPTLTSGFVPEEIILHAKSFTQQGFDWRGQDKSGELWRWFSIPPSDVAHYKGASPKAAHFFDQIIDSVCINF